MLDELFAVARRLGIRVRVEPFETEPVRSGGRCRVHGRELIIVDAASTVPDQVAALAEALAGLETETVHTLPRVRALLDRYQELQAGDAKRRGAD